MSESTRADRAKAEVESEQAPAQQITDFSSLDVTPVTVNRYVVTNRASGTVHTVNLNEPSCDCEDMEYNQEDSGACKHLLYAVYTAPNTRDMSNEVLRDATRAFERMRDSLGSVESGQPTDADTDASQESEKPPANPEHDAAVAQEQAEAKAAELQEAFDNHIDDMQVKAHEGLVWIQTGRDTPEEWPYPGVDETFTAITSPECLMYIHEDHEYYADKPGEWWKNALYPSDVETYISEVLE